MILISGVLKGPYGDARTGVTITMRSMKTSSTVLNLAKSQSVTNDSGQYSLNVEPGAYEVIISVYGAQPERVGTIEVYTDSLSGTLNDFLRRPGESDITPEIVQTVDRMRLEAAASAAAAKLSEQNAADSVKPVVAAGFGSGPLHTADAFAKDNKSSIQRYTVATTNRPGNVSGAVMSLPIDGGPSCAYFAIASGRQSWVGSSTTASAGAITWTRLFSELDKPSVTDISNLKDWGLTGGVTNGKFDYNEARESRRGMVGAGNGAPGPAGATNFLDVYGWKTDGGATPASWRSVQNCFHYGSSGYEAGNVSLRIWQGSSWTQWYAYWTTRNTTVDSNGFIKKASPIARLSSVPEKMADDYLDGFTLAGNVAVNGEADGVSAERVSAGVYKVIGSLGFAEEGWNIEVPQDVNGNRLCFVETSTNRDGTIYVKVSKRRFDIDTAAIVAGEPMDIPDGRWIDLRLEMPVLEVVEDPPEGEA